MRLWSILYIMRHLIHTFVDNTPHMTYRVICYHIDFIDYRIMA